MNYVGRVGTVVLLLAVVLAAIGCTPTVEVNLPILMYHHIDEIGDGSVTVSEATLRKQLSYLADNGYQTIDFEELIAYVDKGKRLPEKPVMLVFDDGYLSNYEILFPILKEYHMKATVCIIGMSVGKSTYRDTDIPITPHFGWDEAREMVASGLVSIVSHTENLHCWQPFESEPVHSAAVPMEGEDEETFAALFTEDFRESADHIERELGRKVTVFAYPNGQYTESTEEILKNEGVRVTLITTEGINTVRYHEPETLYLLKRFNVNETVTSEELRRRLEGEPYGEAVRQDEAESESDSEAESFVKMSVQDRVKK